MGLLTGRAMSPGGLLTVAGLKLWTPNDEPSLRLWKDPSDESLYTKGVNNTFTAWRSKSDGTE